MPIFPQHAWSAHNVCTQSNKALLCFNHPLCFLILERAEPNPAVLRWDGRMVLLSRAPFIRPKAVLPSSGEHWVHWGKRGTPTGFIISGLNPKYFGLRERQRSFGDTLSTMLSLWQTAPWPAEESGSQGLFIIQSRSFAGEE